MDDLQENDLDQPLTGRQFKHLMDEEFRRREERLITAITTAISPLASRLTKIEERIAPITTRLSVAEDGITELYEMLGGPVTVYITVELG